MSRVYTDEQLCAKISSLPAEFQASFLKATDVFMQKETDTFISMIGMSRNEIKTIYDDLIHENKSLKDVADKLRDELKLNQLDKTLQKQQILKRPKAAPIQQADVEKKAVEKYLKEMGRVRTPDTKSTSSVRSDPASRPVTGYKMRMDDKPEEFIQEEAVIMPERLATAGNKEQSIIIEQNEKLMQDLNTQSVLISSEKQRQADMIKEKKEKRKNKKMVNEDLITELMGQGQEMDDLTQKIKDRQEQQLKEKLEKKKKEKEKEETFVEIDLSEEPATGARPMTSKQPVSNNWTAVDVGGGGGAGSEAQVDHRKSPQTEIQMELKDDNAAGGGAEESEGAGDSGRKKKKKKSSKKKREAAEPEELTEV